MQRWMRAGCFEQIVLNNSYDIVRGMRAIPFGLDDISRLAATTAAPLVPLLLTIFPPEELIMRLVKIVF